LANSHGKQYINFGARKGDGQFWAIADFCELKQIRGERPISAKRAEVSDTEIGVERSAFNRGVDIESLSIHSEPRGNVDIPSRESGISRQEQPFPITDSKDKVVPDAGKARQS
jgi:hypothetical protein